MHLKRLAVCEPRLPVISSLLDKIIFDDKTLNANYVRRATIKKIDFLSALKQAVKISTINEEIVWIAIGPHPVCFEFIRSIILFIELVILSIRRGEDNWKILAENMAVLYLIGVEID